MFGLYDKEFIEEKANIKGIKYMLLYIGLIIPYLVVRLISIIPLVNDFIFPTINYLPWFVGFFVRSVYYKQKLRSIGQNVLIDVGVIVTNPENVTIGNNSHIDTYVKIEGGTNGYVEIGDYCHIAPLNVIQGEGGLKIKNYVGIAAGCKIYSGSNYYKDPTSKKKVLSMSASAPKEMQHIIRKEIIIDNFAFIGLNSVILPGIKIGERAVVGAGSCVMRDIPSKTLAVGCPAKVINKIEYQNE
ncbi:hypothetical protein MSIBF_A20001 [groundwater metagenome]|uniref:Acyltransferase n=1 Tax=groundwater metagenome TaxID=717931 RepID=A0A098E9F9_9ZZZZ